MWTFDDIRSYPSFCPNAFQFIFAFLLISAATSSFVKQKQYPAWPPAYLSSSIISTEKVLRYDCTVQYFTLLTYFDDCISSCIFLLFLIIFCITLIFFHITVQILYYDYNIFIVCSSYFYILYCILFLSHCLIIQVKSTKEEFIKFCTGYEYTKHIPKEYISKMYDDILTNPFPMLGKIGKVVESSKVYKVT